MHSHRGEKIYMSRVTMIYKCQLKQEGNILWPDLFLQELVIWGWTMAIGTGFAVVYGMDVPARFDEGRIPSEVTNVFYGSLHRLAWGLALSWVVWACSKGYGGNSLNTHNSCGTQCQQKTSYDFDIYHPTGPNL